MQPLESSVSQKAITLLAEGRKGGRRRRSTGIVRIIGLSSWLLCLSVITSLCGRTRVFVTWHPTHCHNVFRKGVALNAINGVDPEETAAKARAEAELAEARAAVARAKAELAETQALQAAKAVEQISAGTPFAETLADDADDNVSPPPSTPDTTYVPVDLNRFTGNEARPARLLFSPEGAALFDMLQRLDNTPIIIANRTALDSVLQAAMASLWQFAQAGSAAKQGQLYGASDDLRRGIEQLGDAVKPETLATALAPRISEDGVQQGGDWRPLLKSMTNVQQLPEIVEKSVVWEIVFPDAMERATGFQREDLKSRVLAFLPRLQREQPGDWSEAELRAAERLVQSDIGLQRVFARIEVMRTETSNSFTDLWFVPVILLLLLLAISWCFFSALVGGVGGGTSDAPLNPEDVQGLPLLKLNK